MASATSHDFKPAIIICTFVPCFQECSIKMGVDSQTAETLKLLAVKVSDATISNVA